MAASCGPCSEPNSKELLITCATVSLSRRTLFYAVNFLSHVMATVSPARLLLSDFTNLFVGQLILRNPSISRFHLMSYIL